MRVIGTGITALFGLVYRNHNLLIVVAAFASMVVLAVISGYWLFYRAAYVLGGLVPLCLIWARIHIGALQVTVERPSDRLQVGQHAEARVRLKSSSMWTKLWLELEDETDMPGTPSRTVVTIPAKSVRNWKVSMRCGRRGVYTAGPVKVTTGDPFGLFRFSRRFGEKQPLIVLPQAEELPYFWAPAAQLAGEGFIRRPTHYVTPNASGVREYHPGDSYNRIHWKSTARLGRLMVKTFEMDPTSNIWVVVDMHGDVQHGSGDESTEEYGVRIATSIAYKYLQANRMLGLMAPGAENVTLEPARGSHQYGRILEALAVVRATGERPLAQLLQEESRQFGRHTTLILITPSVDEEWVVSLEHLARQGTRIAVVLLEPHSFGGPNLPLPLDSLLASNVLTYVVRARSDIGLMLGPAGVTGENLPQRQKVGVR
jgi:uncharacterized protein (DUF58 family)